MDRPTRHNIHFNKIISLAFLAILWLAILFSRPQSGLASLDQQQAQSASSLNFPDPCTTPIRVMPLGDSITRGSGSANINGYRRPLYQSLTAAGYNVDFVGSQKAGASDFDRDHEGHSGYYAWDATKGSIAPNIYNWLATYPADVVLLHIGTNDISDGTQSASEVAYILDEIDRFSPDTVVVLARIINRLVYSLETTQYNLDIQAMAGARIANGDAIVVVNMESVLNYATDMRDELHPNTKGYGKMAEVWQTALENLLPKCDGATPTATSSPPVSTATPTPTATQPVACGGLLQEAEGGTLSGGFAIGTDAAASGGQYVHAPKGSGFWDTISGNGNRADYCFTVTTAGTYRIKGWAHAASNARNSFFVQVDGSPAAGYLWDVQINTTYLLDYVNDKRVVVVDPVEISLGVGEHSLTFYLREESTRLDKFELELVSTLPTNTPTPTGIIASPTPTPTTNVSPTPTRTATQSSGCGGLLQEAEGGVLSGAFTIGSDAAASGGQYVHAPKGSGFWDTISGNGNRADYCFRIATAGTYRIKGWVHAASTATNSFFVQVDGSPAAGYLWDVQVNTSYLLDYVNDKRAVVVDPVEISLGVGDHSLTFFLREDSTRLDRFELELVSALVAGPDPSDGSALPEPATPTPTGIPSPTPILSPSATATAAPVRNSPSETATMVPSATATPTASPSPASTETPTSTAIPPTETATPTPPG